MKIPPIEGKKKNSERLTKVLEQMKETKPAFYHLFCVTVKKVMISGNDWVFQMKPKVVNLRLRDLKRWVRDELWEYYLVRFGTIMFLSYMGDPSNEGHRGWEEGIMDGWQYAMDHTLIAVDEDPSEFMKRVRKKPPW